MSNDEYTVYIRFLPRDISREKIRKMFKKYEVANVFFKSHYSIDHSSAFVEFKHRKDAKRVIKKYDGRSFKGEILRVEYKKLYDGKEIKKYGNEPKKSTVQESYACKIYGLPNGISWRELKIFLKQYCTSEFCNIGENGIGEVGFYTKQDLNYAIKKLSSKSFKIEGKLVTLDLVRCSPESLVMPQLKK